MIVNGILLESYHDYSSVEKAFSSVGNNTGNNVFREALIKNLHLIQMSYDEYNSISHIFKKLPIIVTDLIWINENSNFDYLAKRLNEHPDVRFVPISVGLQAKKYGDEFKLNKSTLDVLNAIQERAIIGVRGFYSADILNKNGIKNIEVIGCPSIYYNDSYSGEKIQKCDRIDNVSVNFRTIYGNLSKQEKHFLTYCANRNYSFVEQTKYELSIENTGDIGSYNYISKWINRQKNIFFDVKEWKRYFESYQFSIGLRFHGNVVALWNGIPALFITIDSRTSELTEFFNLPSISIDEFDDQKQIEYYYEICDYTDFKREYINKYNKYLNFLKKNEII